MKHSKEVIEKIEKRQQELRAKQMALAKEMRYGSLISFLFNLSILFEEHYANSSHRLSLQNGTKCLGDLILLAVKNQQFPERKDEDIEALQARELGNLLLLSQHKASNHTLEKLNQLFEDHSLLEELRQIEKYDRSCEVVFEENGQFETKLIHLEGRKYDIKTGLKYQYLIDYYGHLGHYIAQHLIDEGNVTLSEGDEANQMASRLQLEAKVAASEYFRHFGIEDRFSLYGKTYSAYLLAEILSLLIVWSQARYGVLLQEHLPNKNVTIAIVRSISSFAKQGGKEIPGPLFFSTWNDLIEQMYLALGSIHPRDEIELHLKFFSEKLPPQIEALDLYQTPLLRMGNIVAFFVRQLVMQNPWMPVINRLVSYQQNKDENERVERSAQRLGEMFREHGFKTIVGHKLYKGGQLLTDIDLAAMKGSHLFLLQLKMTTPKPTYEDVKSHIEDALVTANKQCRKVFSYLRENWLPFRHHFETILEWEELTVRSLIVSTSFERDRDAGKYKDALKISQFELERYLMNDGFLLFPDNDPVKPGKARSFYADGEKLSGQLLQELITGDKLWAFLDTIVENTDVEDYLPKGRL